MEVGWKLFIIILSEFAGTAMLMCLGCMSTTTSENYGRTHVDVGIAFGVVIGFTIYIFGHFSGAYINPWVAVTSCILGRIKWDMMIIYIIADMLGGLFGYSILWLIIPQSALEKGSGLCAVVPRHPIENYKVMLSEFLATGALLFACAGFWDKRNPGPHETVAVRLGFIVAGLVVCMGYFTGVSINFARHMGPAIYHQIFDTIWMYFVAQLAAAIFVGVIWRFVFVSPWAKDEEVEQ